MPFFERQGILFLFIHIPKTGGTSIEAHFQKYSRMFFYNGIRPVPPIIKVSPQHWPILTIRSIFGDDFCKESFTIVRNPFKRLESEYHFQRKYIWSGLSSFDVWLKRSLEICRDDRFHADNHLRPQVEFIDSTVRVYRYENGLESIKANIEFLMGFQSDQQLPKMLSFEKSTTIEWSKESIELVQKFYADDFKVFGYSDEP
jgi:hypothetical protein